MLYRFILTMGLRIIIECIINSIVIDIEGIAIVDLATRRGGLLWHGLELWLRMGRSSIIFSSSAIWKKKLGACCQFLFNTWTFLLL